MDPLSIKTFLAPIYEAARPVYNEASRLVHYTSAENGLKILSSRSIWMRNTTCMNDYMEIEHGRRALSEAWRSEAGQEVKDLINTMHNDSASKIERLFDLWAPIFSSDTYISCLSIHDESENEFGRLSMWRAYGASSGVALVLNPEPFRVQSSGGGIYSTPVIYATQSELNHEFHKFSQRLSKYHDYVSSLTEDELVQRVFNLFRMLVISLKHPGFCEEREWRVYCQPRFEKAPPMQKEIETIGGVPQHVGKLKLVSSPANGLHGIELTSLLERIIIGPTEHAHMIQLAYVEALEQLGFSDPASKVVLSNIPLRN
ncbi:Protein of unknown function [Albimonas donghaensis]|uniref:DUF2971 domain-containing protein n=1 Tax=Albimonas donghaensis TaxID=356660 RepID=A0A1H2T7Z8_9RHOB|nr:DUF2971 domain-containing protein [Albimonas donghaensis]SDW39364.1 Protein of unknown function [Albimonas donghaensis]